MMSKLRFVVSPHWPDCSPVAIFSMPRLVVYELGIQDSFMRQFLHNLGFEMGLFLPSSVIVRAIWMSKTLIETAILLPIPATEMDLSQNNLGFDLDLCLSRKIVCLQAPLRQPP